MRNEKLRQINNSINGIFKQTPREHINQRDNRENYQPAYKEYQGCSLCEEVRRDNYRLKQ